MKGATPVPGPIRIKGVERFAGSWKSLVGFGNMLTLCDVPEEDDWLKNGEHIHSRYRVAIPPIRLLPNTKPAVEGVR